MLFVFEKEGYVIVYSKFLNWVGLNIGQTGQIPGTLHFWGPCA